MLGTIFSYVSLYLGMLQFKFSFGVKNNIKIICKPEKFGKKKLTD